MSLKPLDDAAVRRWTEQAVDSYEAHAILYQELEDRLLERLPHFERPIRRGLDLGSGPGRGTAALRAAFPQAAIVAMDWVMPMVRKAGLPALCADLRSLPVGPATVDLVYSSGALPWASDLESVFAEIRRVLRPGGLFLFSTFGPDTLIELRSAWARVEGTPRVHAYPDMHDLGDALLRAGFRDPVMDRENLVLTYPDVDSLVRELRALGTRNAAQDRTRGLTGKSRWAAMTSAYEALSNGDRIEATHELVFGVALAPEQGQPIRTPEGEVAHFSVDSLRKPRE